MNYPDPIACIVCGHATIGTYPGGLCRVCANEWRVTATKHAQCDECLAQVGNAIAHAKATGSRGCMYGNGHHAVTVDRITAPIA
jgi:hypothetical protein